MSWKKKRTHQNERQREREGERKRDRERKRGWKNKEVDRSSLINEVFCCGFIWKLLGSLALRKCVEWKTSNFLPGRELAAFVLVIKRRCPIANAGRELCVCRRRWWWGGGKRCHLRHHKILECAMCLRHQSLSLACTCVLAAACFAVVWNFWHHILFFSCIPRLNEIFRRRTFWAIGEEVSGNEWCSVLIWFVRFVGKDATWRDSLEANFLHVNSDN